MWDVVLFCIIGACLFINAQITFSEMDFLDIRSSDIFVDKTLLLKEIFNHDITVITAPRQFGKSTNFDMISEFLRNDRNITEVRSFFRDTKIWKDDDFVTAHMNNHPVLYCNFDSGVDITDQETLLTYYRQILYGIFIEHDYLKDSPVLNEKQKGEFMNFIENNDVLESWKVQNGLKFLCQLLHLHHVKSVIVLIDDYDSIIVNEILTDSNATNDAEFFKTTRDIFHFHNDLFKNTLENNKDIEIALITGTLPIVLDQFRQKGSTKVKYVGFTQEKEYAKFYGFTEKEVKPLLQKYKISSELQTEVYKWYKGYSRPKGKVQVLNPLSIVKFIKNKIALGYWVKSFPINHIVLPLMANIQIQNTMIELVNSSSTDVGLRVKKAFTQHDLEQLKRIVNNRIDDKTNVDLFFQFLLHVGYLTFEKPRKRLDKFLFQVRVPNKEINEELLTALEKYFISKY